MIEIFFYTLLLLNARLEQSRMVLPLEKGTIVHYKDEAQTGIEILPTDIFEVRSCSNATIHFLASMDFNERTLVIARKDSFDFIYVLDSSFVEKGQKILRGQVIGKLRDNNKKEQEPLVFFVKFKGEDVNPRYYLTYVYE